MEGFSAAELGPAFDLEFSLNWGLLPFVQLERHNAADILEAYVNTYLKEEIREEGLVRNVPPFLRFLNVAGQLNGQSVHGQNIAREGLLTTKHHRYVFFRSDRYSPRPFSASLAPWAQGA